MMEGRKREDGEIPLSNGVTFKKKRGILSASSQEEKKSSRQVFACFPIHV